MVHHGFKINKIIGYSQLIVAHQCNSRMITKLIGHTYNLVDRLLGVFLGLSNSSAIICEKKA